jgi:AcrR family transcriptional regulator
MKDSNGKGTRELILDATDKLLARSGYKKMTIDDLAREVGIGKGSIYLHFKSKEEIALSHIDRIIMRVKQKLQAIADSQMPCEDRIVEMLVERVLCRFDSVQHYSQSFDEMLSHLRPKLLQRRERYFEEESRIFARVLDEGKCRGIFLDGDPIEKASVLLTATNSLLPFSLTTRELGKRKEIENKTRKVAELLLTGLLKDKSNYK